MQGIALVIIISPGAGAMDNDYNGNSTLDDDTRFLENLENRQPGLLENLLDLGRNLVPENLVGAAFEQAKTIYETTKTEQGEIIFTRRITTVPGKIFIGLVAISLVLGSILSTLGDEVTILLDVFKASDRLASKCLGLMLWITPVGVAFIICGKISEIEDLTGTLAILGWFILTVTIGIFIDQFISMPLLYFIFLRKNPFTFYLNVLPATVMAFVTRSSAVTLPVTLRCLDEKVKVDPRISHFVVPVGVTVNKNGTALFIAVASVFMAQLSGVSLGLPNYISICISATAMSIAAGGPSGSLFILQSLGIPVSNIALLFTIDWLMDRLRTMNNVLGDCYAVAIVEHLSKKPDLPEKATKTPVNDQTI